jgi:hypothetical protein
MAGWPMAEMMNAKDFFGPLAALIGEWKGDKGMDIAPEPGGEEHSPYYETILIEPVGDATNAEEQTLGVLSYKQVVHRKSNGEVFHHQIGYWYFERKTGEILYSLVIPRAVAVLARGNATESGEKTSISVKADAADKNYGIIESAFMTAKASTQAFTMDVSVTGNSMTYKMNTGLHIYGKDFAHTDENTLTRSL